MRKVLCVLVKNWHQQKYGNTYHVVSITYLDKLGKMQCINLPMTFGGDNSGLYDALEYMREQWGLDIPKDVNPSIWLRENNVAKHVVSVNSKRDMMGSSLI